MAMSSSTDLVLTVARREAEVIAPATPTPYQLLNLSDLDDQRGLRNQIPVLQFYPCVPGMQGKDPVKVIRKAIAETLVYYYPFAGRLRDGVNDKLMVECTGEGVVFIEASADVSLDQFGVLQPPFPGLDDLLYDVPGTAGIVNCPLLLIQITRLTCGGFIFAVRLNHTMTDAVGLVQFMTAIGEIARGQRTPSILPEWKREMFLNARDPPRVTCIHGVYDQLPATTNNMNMDMAQLILRSVFFSLKHVERLRNQLAHHSSLCSKFDILAACLWKCRTIALNLSPQEEVRIAFPVNARGMFNPPLPVGYYGNAIGVTVALSTVAELCHNPLAYAVGLIRKAKASVTAEFMRSSIDLLVQRGRPSYAYERTYVIADLTRMGFTDVDFGWGKALYAGPPGASPVGTFFMCSRNHDGEEGIVVPICLPRSTMEMFAVEIKKMIDM